VLCGLREMPYQLVYGVNNVPFCLGVGGPSLSLAVVAYPYCSGVVVFAGKAGSITRMVFHFPLRKRR